MITLPEIWDIMVMKIPGDEWMQLQEIYALVRKYSNLDDEDYEPQAPGSATPKWERNVRNVLQYRKRKGHIGWDGKAHYKFK